MYIVSAHIQQYHISDVVLPLLHDNQTEKIQPLTTRQQYRNARNRNGIQNTHPVDQLNDIRERNLIVPGTGHFLRDGLQYHFFRLRTRLDRLYFRRARHVVQRFINDVHRDFFYARRFGDLGRSAAYRQRSPRVAGNRRDFPVNISWFF